LNLRGKVEGKAMLEFMSENFCFIVPLLCSTVLFCFIGTFFVSRRTLCIFFGAWYVALSLFIAGGELATYTSPWCFFLLHLALVFLLGRLCGAVFTWKQYSLMVAASLIFSSVVLLGALTAPVGFR